MHPLLQRYKELGHDIKYKELSATLRVNTLVTTAEKLVARLLEEKAILTKIVYTKNGFIVKSPQALASMTPYLLGQYYIQESAAQIPVEILDPQPGETILDMCASPGGKTTQIAQHMNNTGEVHAFELKHHRIERLANNLERMRVSNVYVYENDAMNAPEGYDRVLLDAPCSGNLASDKEWLEKRTVQGIKENVVLQQRLLSHAIKVCAPGGVIVYSTCSLEPEENEEVITNALNKHKNISLEQVETSIGVPGLQMFKNKIFHPDIKKTKRCWPDVEPTQGFFIAKIRKNIGGANL